MGQAYRSLNDNHKSEEYWRQALTIYEAIESPYAQWVREWLGELEDEE
jgi:hypothetical protein